VATDTAARWYQPRHEWKTMSGPLSFAPMSLGVLDEPFDHDEFIFELPLRS
jgi:hypothetical protein